MRVLICDDHRLFAQAMAVVLRGAGHQVVGCLTRPDDAVLTVTNEIVDVCLMDLHFPRLNASGRSGVDAVADIVARSQRTRVVVVTGSSDPQELARAIQAGARGLAPKDEEVHRLVDTLERVHQGEIVIRMPATLSSTPLSSTPVVEKHSLVRFLTPREREVLERLVAGQSTADVASAMGVRYSTARTHIQNTLTKLGVHSKLEAVAFAVSNRVVAIPDRTVPTYARSTT